MRVAIIPARGGSKRIPGKNTRMFCGRPMLAWSVTAALESGCFEQVIVSTDDKHIAEVARSCGASVPFIRPAELADDYSTSIAVISHAVGWLRTHHHHPNEVCCIYATAPFIRIADLQNGLKLLQQNDCDYVFTVSDYPFPIQRALRQNPEGRVEMFSPENFLQRSQDLESAFHDAGQFYWGWADSWVQGRSVFTSGSIPLRLPRYRVQDIDTLEDWKQAELMFSVLQSETPSF